MPKRNHSSIPKDAITMLVEDHEKVQKLFEEFEKIRDDEAAKQDLVDTVCAELTIHTQLEEEIFYPAVREAIDDEDLMNEAEVEHNNAKQIINDLIDMQPDDELYDATFTVLGEGINHHIAEEQEAMFPKVKKAKLDLEALGEEMLQRKQELQAEMGVEDEEEVEEPQSSGKKSR
jgi:hemerythrin-like domain-containing protein